MISQLLLFAAVLIGLVIIVRFIFKKPYQKKWLIFRKIINNGNGIYEVCYWAQNRISNAATQCYGSLNELKIEIMLREGVG